jgi:hypothetical protein
MARMKFKHWRRYSMKVIATIALALALSGAAYAAPMNVEDGQTNTVMAGDNIETAGSGNYSSTSVISHEVIDCGPGPGTGALPEPGSMALLGIGVGLVTLFRRKK